MMMDTYILFTVAGSTYAVSSELVQQVEMIERITHVPNTPDFIEGIVYLRGQVVPVINLRHRFGMENRPDDIRTRLVVVRLNGRVVGLKADSAREFVQIPPDAVDPPPADLTGPGVEYLHGVVSLAGRLVLVLNLAQLLNREEKNALAQPIQPDEAKEQS